MGKLDKVKAWFQKKPYIPRADIPEENDKDKAAERKGIWDFFLVAAVEALFFIAMFMVNVYILAYGFLLGLIITLIVVLVPCFIIVLLKLRATVKRSNRMGQYTPYNLIAFNKAGKKYEDHFFLKELIKVEDAAIDEDIYRVEGAFRHKRPLERFYVRTKYPWGEHVEHTDATETVNQGSVAIKKDMPLIVLRQIGEYGEYGLPLMRFESSCVSRRDKKLFEADLSTVLETYKAIDGFESKEKDKKIFSLENTNKSLERALKEALEDREKEFMRRQQKREIGEEQDQDERRKPSWQVALPYVLILLTAIISITGTWLMFRIIFGV